MFCNRCGKPLNPNDSFCSNCGAEVTADNASAGTGNNFGIISKIIAVLGKIVVKLIGIIIFIIAAFLVRLLVRELIHESDKAGYLQYLLPGIFAGIVSGIICGIVLEKLNIKDMWAYVSFFVCIVAGIAGGIFFAIGAAVIIMLISLIVSRLR